MLDIQKSLFSLPEGLHFLNCASRAPLLNEAQALGVAGLRRQIAPVSHGPEEYARESEDLRRAVARPEDTARVSSLWNERLLDAIDAQTAVVNVSSVHWTDGVRFDLEAIGRRAREVGAVFVVDGTQSIGASDFDFARTQPDLLVCAGYKWLLGPYQIGFAALGERLMDTEPFEYHWSNRAGSHDTTATAYRQEYEKGARRFDVGEHANTITVPMLTEGVRQAKAWGSEAIQDYCTTLGRPLAQFLEDERFSVAPVSQRIAHIIGVRLANTRRIPAVMGALVERQVRVSQRGYSIRISPHVYNAPEDIDALVDGLAAGLDAT